MALVVELEPCQKERQAVHKKTRCLFSVVNGSDGNRYFQLDTYGSDERQHPEKVSQSLQFDAKAAQQLVDLLKQTFPNLR
ncbi:MAG: hypothetical protein U0793_24675 [Gemmataceae bacterium]